MTNPPDEPQIHTEILGSPLMTGDDRDEPPTDTFHQDLIDETAPRPRGAHSRVIVVRFLFLVSITLGRPCVPRVCAQFVWTQGWASLGCCSSGLQPPRGPLVKLWNVWGKSRRYREIASSWALTISPAQISSPDGPPSGGKAGSAQP